MLDCGGPLCKAKVGDTIHADIAIAIWQLSSPGHSILAIEYFTAHGVPFTFRHGTATRILYDHNIASTSYLCRVHHRAANGQVFSIWQASEQNRPLPFAYRTIHVAS